jgi:N,N-dimethylformamidase
LKQVIGYSTPWSARPGETVTLHVSLLEGETYALDVVRVVSGDADGVGLDLRPIPSPIDGIHPGEPRRTVLGSCMIVDPPPRLDPVAWLEIDLDVWPTLPGRGVQRLVGQGDDAGGWSLDIDEEGRPRFQIHAGQTTGVVVGDRPLSPRAWVRLRARFDPAAGEMTLVLSGRGDPVLGPAWTVESRTNTEIPELPRPDAPLVVAARTTPTSLGDHFNGKIANLALTSGGETVAAWDFSPGDAGPEVAEPIGGWTGRLVNLPARAVTGPEWTGDVHDWRAAPTHYAAIHFHEDDLYDAAWPVSHRLTIPADWPSGYHAVRLRSGDDTSYLPLFVRPPLDRPGADLMVLMSTLTVQAYANYHFHLRVGMNEQSLGRVAVLSPEDQALAEDPTFGLSTYDLHADGSPVRFASRLRPILNGWPGGDIWNLNADTHILAWLDHLGVTFDIVTDDDLHAEGKASLSPHRVLIVGSHPEYWTTPMWKGLEAWIGGGGRLMYLGGNGFYWRTAKHPAWPAAIEVRHAEGGGRYTAETSGDYHLAFTAELGGLWRRVGRPPNALVGVGTRAMGFDGAGRYRRTAESRDPRVAWIFEGIEAETFGEAGLLGSAAGYEMDAADMAIGTPAHAIVVAASEGHTAATQPMPEEILMPHPAMGAPFNPRVRAEAVFFETAAGGAVFSASSVTWPAALPAHGWTGDIARITGNILRRFLDRRPFKWPPTGPGSTPPPGP